MARPLSRIAPECWDYSTLAPELHKEVTRLTVRDIERLGRGRRSFGWCRTLFAAALFVWGCVNNDINIHVQEDSSGISIAVPYAIVVTIAALVVAIWRSRKRR